MTISINIQQPNLNPYSSRQYNADVTCECCGRGIANRDNAHVVQVISRNRETGDTIFAQIEWSKVAGRDSVEWGASSAPTARSKSQRDTRYPRSELSER